MPRQWIPNWDNYTTPIDLLTLMLTQLGGHIEAALAAARKIRDGVDVPYNLRAFLTAAASAASFPWPSPSRRAPLRRAHPNRGADIIDLLGLDDNQPVDLAKIRNDLIHADERFEELYLENPDLPLTAWGESTNAIDPERIYYMSYNPETETIHSLGVEVDLAEVTLWLREVRERSGLVFLQTMMRGGRERHAARLECEGAEATDAVDDLGAARASDDQAGDT